MCWRNSRMNLPEKKAASLMPKNKKNRTILVVDDEPSILNLCRRLLQREGFDTVTADTAGEGLRLATAGPATRSCSRSYPRHTSLG